MEGVYIIRCIQEQEVYIGSSINIEARWWHHKWLLNNDKHPNYKLQDAWDAYGCDSFIFEVVEETKDLTNTEQKYLDAVWPICYNINNVTGPTFANKEIMLARRFEKRESYGTGNTLTETQVKDIIRRINNNELHRVIAKDFNVAINTISCINTGYSWAHLNHLVNKSKLDNKSMRESDKQEAFILFGEGKTRKEVQNTIKRSKATVCRYHLEYQTKSKG